MPITQTRMLALINDFDTMFQRHTEQRRALETMLRTCETKEDLIAGINAVLIGFPCYVSTAFIEERGHFRRNAQRNASAAARQRTYRAIAGASQRQQRNTSRGSGGIEWSSEPGEAAEPGDFGAGAFADATSGPTEAEAYFGKSKLDEIDAAARAYDAEKTKP